MNKVSYTVCKKVILIAKNNNNNTHTYTHTKRDKWN